MAKRKKFKKKKKRNKKANGSVESFTVSRLENFEENIISRLEKKNHRFVEFKANGDLLIAQCLGCFCYAIVEGHPQQDSILLVWGTVVKEECCAPLLAEERYQELKRAEAPSP